MKTTQELINLVTLTKQDNDSYVGNSFTVGSPNVFGGQVVAQALNAAYKTISNNRILHSMHSYFLEPGDLSLPITYKVDESRNGGSFSTRRVTALQNDKTIFILAASFHKKEEGYTFQSEMPKDIKPPESVLSWSEIYQQLGSFLQEEIKDFLNIDRPIEIKPVVVPNPMDAKDLPPFNHFWIRLKKPVSTIDLAMKQQILAYMSDYNILSVALFPHSSKAHFGNMQMASLDHAVWFFNDFDLEEWLLFSIEVVNTSNARGFCKGNIYTQSGVLIASVTQEGLVRPIQK